MKNSGTNINYEKEISNSQMEQHLSYSMSPTKFTKGSQFGAGDKTFMNSLKIQSDTLLKKKKVLEDEQYKLQNKIKQLEEKLSASIEKNQFLSIDVENSQKTIKNIIVKLEYLTTEKNSLEKELQLKKEYITKLEFKLTSKAPFSTKRDHGGIIENETKTQELIDLEEELKRKIKKLEKLAIESEEKMRENKKFNNKELIRRNQELSNEVQELYKVIESLNDKNLSMKQEIENLQKNIDETKLECFSQQNFFEAAKKKKEYEFDKHSEKQNFFKEEIKKLNSQLHDQEQYIKELLKEIDQLKYAKTINKEFNKEVEKMKNIINKLENEIEKLKNEKKEILKEKQEFEIKYNEIIQTDFASITPKNVLNKLDQNQYNENEVTNEKQQEMQIGIMREEMEHMNLEKSKLKATLNEAINKCAAYVMKEKEWKQQLQEKQKTIDNLLTSKSKLKETLTDQIYTLRNQNKYIDDERGDLNKKNQVLEEENEALRTLIKRIEKNKLK